MSIEKTTRPVDFESQEGMVENKGKENDEASDISSRAFFRRRLDEHTFSLEISTPLRKTLVTPLRKTLAILTFLSTHLQLGDK